MKIIRITTVTLAACAAVLTFMSEIAQAKQPGAPVEIARGQAIQASGIQPQFVDPSRFFTGVCIVGPRVSDVIFTCFGIGFPAASPRAVFCQLRNSSAQPIDFPDQFACQVTRTSPGSVTVRIRRIDDGTDSSGWGQDLRLNLLIVN